MRNNSITNVAKMAKQQSNDNGNDSTIRINSTLIDMLVASVHNSEGSSQLTGSHSELLSATTGNLDRISISNIWLVLLMIAMVGMHSSSRIEKHQH